MKTFALVDIAGIRHMVDDYEQARWLRDEAAARGLRLILVKPMETILNEDLLAAIEAAIKRDETGNATEFGAMIMSAIDDLRSAVSKNTSAIDSALTLIKGFASRASESSDPAMLDLAAEVNAKADALAAAVVANTPSAPASEPTQPAPETPTQ